MKLIFFIVCIAVILQSGHAEVAEQNLRRGNLSPEVTSSNVPSTTATDAEVMNVASIKNFVELPSLPLESTVPSTGASIQQPTTIARMTPINSVNPTKEKIAAMEEAHDIRVQACANSKTMVKSSNTAKLIPQPTLIPIFAYASSTTTASSWWGTTGTDQYNIMSGMETFMNDLFPPLAPTDFFYPLQQYFETYSSGMQGGLSSTALMWTLSAGTKTISQATLESNLRAWAAGNNIPADVGQNIYVFFMPPNFVVTMTGGDKSCIVWCGYHGVAATNGGTLRYMVLPYMANSGCSTGCSFGVITDTLTSYRTTFSHELAEAMTDPDLSTGYRFPSSSSASFSGYEIGDVCNTQSKNIVANGVTYTVQKEWSNSACACV